MKTSAYCYSHPRGRLTWLGARLLLVVSFAGDSGCTERREAMPVPSGPLRVGIEISLDSVSPSARIAARNSYFFTDTTIGGACPRTVNRNHFSIAYDVSEQWRYVSAENLVVYVYLKVLGDVEVIDSSIAASYRIAERMATDTIEFHVSRTSERAWKVDCDGIRAYSPLSETGDSSMYVNGGELIRLQRRVSLARRD